MFSWDFEDESISESTRTKLSGYIVQREYIPQDHILVEYCPLPRRISGDV
jgi:hypothetical protein